MWCSPNTIFGMMFITYFKDFPGEKHGWDRINKLCFESWHPPNTNLGKNIQGHNGNNHFRTCYKLFFNGWVVEKEQDKTS